MDEGFAHLAEALHNHSSQVAGAMSKTLWLDFGEILRDYSLLTNMFPHPLRKEEYSVCRQLTIGETDTHLTYTVPPGMPLNGTHSHGPDGVHEGHTSGTGEHSHGKGAHIHDVLIPETMRWLHPGDRVLVAWIGREAVVIDIILPATVLGGS